MIGKTTRDIEHYNPRCNARGVVKSGTPVKWIRKGDWAAWVVIHRHNASFMSHWDWQHSYVDVPADAVEQVSS